MILRENQKPFIIVCALRLFTSVVSVPWKYYNAGLLRIYSKLYSVMACWQLEAGHSGGIYSEKVANTTVRVFSPERPSVGHLQTHHRKRAPLGPREGWDSSGTSSERPWGRSHRFSTGLGWHWGLPQARTESTGPTSVPDTCCRTVCHSRNRNECGSEGQTCYRPHQAAGQHQEAYPPLCGPLGLPAWLASPSPSAQNKEAFP